MISDETAYRRYLNGEEQAADLLVERYGDALTLYINARIRESTASPFCTWTIWTLSRRVSC